MKLLLVVPFLVFHVLCSRGAKIKIIDGEKTQPHSRPYMALIKFETENEETLCGGSLIHPRWVLTAAHCFMFGSFVSVILGAHDKDNYEKEKQVFRFPRSFTHPQYNHSNQFNDLKLYRLPRAARLGKAVQVLPLPKTFDDLPEGTVCETAGWGKTEKADVSKYLLQVNVTVLSRQTCADRYVRLERQITENMMCTSVGPGGQDTCTGDSGGPLICKGVLSGVTSFGPKKCGQADKASVFTRLTQQYITWIQSKINGSKFSE